MTTTMPIQPLPLSRVAIHTMTTRPWSLHECIDNYEAAGIGGISVWRETIEPIGVDEAARMLRDSSLRVPALVRGGFFVHRDGDARQNAIDESRRVLDDAASIGAEMLVIVPGAQPEVPLADGSAMVQDALALLVDHAASCGVRLALEPLHPMYAADRSCINTLQQARQMCEAIGHAMLGVAVDVYHVWWDVNLQSELEALGAAGRLFAFHINDWLPRTNHLLTDRGLMGEGCIPIQTIRTWMQHAGFSGMTEVEILSERWWRADQGKYLKAIINACGES